MTSGDTDAAISIASAIESADLKDASYADVAEHIAGSGDLKHALEMAGHVVDESFKESTLLRVALALVKAGKISSAEVVAAVIGTPAFKVRALCEIAAAHMIVCRAHAARSMYLEAKNIADAAEYISPDLIVVQAQIGDLPGALDAVDSISDPLQRDRVLRKISNWIADKRRIPEALEILTMIASDIERAQGLQHIGIRQALAGDVAEALHTARQIDMYVFHSEALRKLAAVQALRCDCIGANKTLMEAEHAARAVDPGGGTDVIILSEIAVVYAEVGNCDAAKHTFGKAVKASAAYSDSFYRANLLFKIARAQSRSGLHCQALEWTRDITSPLDRAYALLGIANGTLDQGSCATRR